LVNYGFNSLSIFHYFKISYLIQKIPALFLNTRATASNEFYVSVKSLFSLIFVLVELIFLEAPAFEAGVFCDFFVEGEFKPYIKVA